MNPQRYTSQHAKRNTGDDRQSAQPEWTQEWVTADAAAQAEQAARSVMHPESYDPDWRYYHGAMGG